MAKSEKKTAFYELTFIARQDLAKSDVDALADTYTTLLGKHGGKVVKREYWGLRPLAYEIGKNRRGHYVFLGIQAPSAALDAVTADIRISEEIVRQMVVKVDKIDQKPSPVLQRSDDSEAA
jgi:small subunit ribosomal protein S6